MPQLVAESNFIITLPERLARKLASVYPARLLPPPPLESQAVYDAAVGGEDVGVGPT